MSGAKIWPFDGEILVTSSSISVHPIKGPYPDDDLNVAFVDALNAEIKLVNEDPAELSIFNRRMKTVKWNATADHWAFLYIIAGIFLLLVAFGLSFLVGWKFAIIAAVVLGIVMKIMG